MRGIPGVGFRSPFMRRSRGRAALLSAVEAQFCDYVPPYSQPEIYARDGVDSISRCWPGTAGPLSD